MITLDGSPLDVAALVAVARHGAKVTIAPGVAGEMGGSRRIVEGIDARDEAVYGVTTGFGALADTAIASEDRVALQHALIRSHAAGMGAPLDPEQVRGMMLLRARTLAAGHSGVRPALVEGIIALLNADIVPHVPEYGSLGASGDLAPLAHAAAVLLGEGHVLCDGGPGREPAATALARAGIAPLAIDVKEGLALINGTDAMAATMALAVTDLGALMRAADCACAMSVEALLGTDAPFDRDVVALRDSDGVGRAAANLRALLRDSAIVASHRESDHAVQDAYSLRCAPQVHGAARDLLDFASGTVARELASVVDNPVVDVGRERLRSSGNFHGQALSYAADMCASACADIAAISERRIDRLLDPVRSRGLPAFLAIEPGVNSGLMMAQYPAAACVAQLRHDAAPLAVQSATTSGSQEDHVSMGWVAAQRTRRSVDVLRRVVAVEFVAAAQALDFRAPLTPGPGTGALLESLRTRVAHLDEDRFLGDDLSVAERWVRDLEWRTAVEGRIGELL